MDPKSLEIAEGAGGAEDPGVVGGVREKDPSHLSVGSSDRDRGTAGRPARKRLSLPARPSPLSPPTPLSPIPPASHFRTSRIPPPPNLGGSHCRSLPGPDTAGEGGWGRGSDLTSDFTNDFTNYLTSDLSSDLTKYLNSDLNSAFEFFPPLPLLANLPASLPPPAAPSSAHRRRRRPGTPSHSPDGPNQ